MKRLPSVNFPPEKPPGKFLHNMPYTVYHSSGEVQSNPSVPVTDRTISLNELAIGEAIAKAEHVANEAVWFFAVVLQDGSQHVYEGTPSQAANGMGFARIRGCKALNKWVEDVTRTARRHPAGTVQDDHDGSVATPPIRSPVHVAENHDGSSVGTPPTPSPAREVPPDGAVFQELAEGVHSWMFTQADGTSVTRYVLTEAIAHVHTLFDCMGRRAPGAPEVPTIEKQRHFESLKKRPHE